MRAFFYRDEIERQARMRCWYFGCQIGVLIAGLATLSILFFGFPAPGAIINLLLHGRPRLPRVLFPLGFATGMTTLALAQAIGALLMRAFMFLPKRGS